MSPLRDEAWIVCVAGQEEAMCGGAAAVAFRWLSRCGYQNSGSKTKTIFLTGFPGFPYILALLVGANLWRGGGA